MNGDLDTALEQDPDDQRAAITDDQRDRFNQIIETALEDRIGPYDEGEPINDRRVVTAEIVNDVLRQISTDDDLTDEVGPILVAEIERTIKERLARNRNIPTLEQQERYEQLVADTADRINGFNRMVERRTNNLINKILRGRGFRRQYGAQNFDRFRDDVENAVAALGGGGAP